MPKIVEGKCQCGSTKLVVTRELSENAVEGYCLGCNQVFGGGCYVQYPSEEVRVTPGQPTR
jgi:hypothetical protein